MDTTVIGAGTGGLTAAIALPDREHRVRLYEQAGTLAEIGAALSIGDDLVPVEPAPGGDASGLTLLLGVRRRWPDREWSRSRG